MRRNSLWALDIPDLDPRAFQHCGNRKIRLYGGGDGGGGGGDGAAEGGNTAANAAAEAAAAGIDAGPSGDGAAEGGNTAANAAAEAAAAAAQAEADAQAAAYAEAAYQAALAEQAAAAAALAQEAAAAQAAAEAAAQAAAIAAQEAAIAQALAEAQAAQDAAQEAQAQAVASQVVSDIASLGLSLPGATSSLSGTTGQVNTDLNVMTLIDLALQQNVSTYGGLNSASSILSALQQAGYGELEGVNPNNPTQSIDQLMASFQVHSYLNDNISNIMGAIGGPVVGSVVSISVALAQGKSPSSIIGQFALSIVGSLLSNATGLQISSSTLQSAAEGKLGQAAFGVAIGKVSQETGLPVGTVQAALTGNLGGAVSNTIVGAVLSETVGAFTGPLAVLTASAIANTTTIAVAQDTIANAINSNSVIASVNSVTSGINQAVNSASIGVPGGVENVSNAIATGQVDTSPSTGGDAAADQGQLALSNSGELINFGTTSGGTGGSSLSSTIWNNLFNDLLAFERKKTPITSTQQTQEINNSINIFTAFDQLEAQKGGALTDLEVNSILTASDPVAEANRLYTTENEARQFWVNVFGTEPNEVELGQMIGYSEQQAKDFASNKATTDSNELDAILRRTGASRFNLTVDQKSELLGLPERDVEDRITKLTQAANLLEGQGGTLNQNTLDYLFKSQNPVADANALYTTEAEARDFWRQTVGTEPTADDLMDMIGLTESAVKTQFGDIAYDRANVSSDELDQFLNQYGQGKLSLTDDEKMYLLGRSEAEAKNIIVGKYNEFLEDKKSTDGQEALDLWKKAGLSERDLTADQLKMMTRGSEAEAETYAQRLADIKAATYAGDPAMDQAATEAAAKAAGYNNYTYNGQTYLVNDRNIAAAFDGGLQQETTRLVQRVLDSKGLSMADMTPEQIAQIRNSVHAVYGNDVSQIKGASAQDFLSGNIRSQEELTEAINNRDDLRVVINRAAPAIDENRSGLSKSELDEISGLFGVRLATGKEAFEDSLATQIVLSNGRIAYVINDPKEEGGLGGIFEDLELLRQQQQLSPEDPRSADPLLYLETVSKLDPNKTTVSDSIIDVSKYLVDFIKSSNLTPGQKQGLTDAVSVTLQGTAELVELFSDAAFGTGLVTRENAAYLAAQKVAEYGASIQSASTKQQEENILKAISDARGFWGTLGATVKTIAQNPAGALTLLGKEGVQEGPLFLASGGLGRVALGLAGKGLAYATATGSNVFLNGAESFGANFGETYDNVRKQGGSHEQAMTQGQKAGAQAALASGLLAGVADKALLKTFMGDVGKVTLPQFTGMAAKQYAEGWGSEFVENASMQYNSFGKVDWQQSRNAGAIGGILEMGVGVGLMAPDALSQNLPVARDLNGNVVTLSEYMSGTKQIQPGSFNMDAITVPVGEAQVTLGDLNRVADVATADQNFSLTAYKTNLDSLANAGYDDANIGNIALSVTTATDAQSLTQNLQSLGVQGVDLANAVDIRFDEAATTPQEVQDAFSQYGYFSPDTQMVESFVGVNGDANLQSAVADYVDRNYIDLQEVKEAAAAQGVTLTDEQAQQYVRQMEEQAGLQAVQTAVDPLAVTRQEAIDSLVAAGYTPDLAAAAADQFVGQYAESDLAGRTGAYVGERQITEQEARAMLEEAGYTNPTPEEVSQFIKISADPVEEATKQAIEQFADPKVVTAEEVREAYRQLGLPDPTDADVQALVGQYSETDLAGRAQESLDTARYNSLAQKIQNITAGDPQMETRLTDAINAARQAGLEGDAALQQGLDSLAASLGMDKADLLAQLGTTEAKIREDFAAQIGGVQTQIGDVQAALTQAIADAKAAGLQGDAALQSAINSVASDLNTSKEALLGQIGKTESQLRSDFSTQLGVVTAELGNVESRLSNAIADARAAGLEGDAALQGAIETVASDLGIAKTDLLAQIGKSEEALRTDFATELGGVREQIGDVQTALTQAIADARSAGLEGDAALQSAINSVASDLGVAKTDLLTQIGKSEETLRTDFATELGGVREELGGVETRLSQAIADARAAGLEGDAALQSAINTVASDLNLAKTDVLAQLGKSEEALRADFATELGGVREALGDVESRLADAIAAAEAAGLSRDEALTSAINSVAADLGITKTDLLGQIGKSEETLRAELEAGLGGIETQLGDVEIRLTEAIAAAEAAGLSRDQAIQAGLDAVATDLNITKTDLLAQIGKSEQTLRAELGETEAALRGEISSSQQAILDRVAAYEAAGISRDQALNLAIGEVATQLGVTEQALRTEFQAGQAALGEQIATGLEGLQTNLAAAETRINERAAEYEAAGLARDQALDKAIKDVAAELNVTAETLGKQIAETETALGKRIGDVETRVSQQIQDVALVLGKPAQSVTQADINYVNSIITGQQTTPDLTYDVNRDGRIDQTDLDYLTRIVSGDVGEPPEFAPGTRWAPTGVFGEIAGLRGDLTGQLQELERQRAADAEAAAEAARQAEANARARFRQQRQQAARQQLFGMLTMPGATGQMVQVKTPEVAKIGPQYDWSSIFRTPEQQKFFASPYGQYGYADGGEVTEEELLNIVRG